MDFFLFILCRSQGRDKSEIEVHLEKSEAQLEELINFGNELVNNIKGANEQHELLQSREKTQNAAGMQTTKYSTIFKNQLFSFE